MILFSISAIKTHVFVYFQEIHKAFMAATRKRSKKNREPTVHDLTVVCRTANTLKYSSLSSVRIKSGMHNTHGKVLIVSGGSF